MRISDRTVSGAAVETASSQGRGPAAVLITGRPAIPERWKGDKPKMLREKKE